MIDTVIDPAAAALRSFLAASATSNPVKHRGSRDHGVVTASPARVAQQFSLDELLVRDHHGGKGFDTEMSFINGTWPRARIRVTTAALAVAGAMALAGCGGGSTPAPLATAATPSAAASTAPAGGSTGTGAGGDSCGATTVALLKTLLTQAGIVSISNDGGCHDATIVTTLTDSTKGLAICDAAAQVAYASGDISSITVTGANDKELSIGIKGQPCIGEP
jgi:hypothetical protein